MKKHLWECNHSHYCEPCNYFSDECTTYHKSFADFLAEGGDSDKDYNLLFRWDWTEEDPETCKCTYRGDDYYRNGLLLLFFMGQNKGLYSSAEINVCRADEPAVIEYLKPRWEHMQSLWAPFKAKRKSKHNV